MHVHRWDAEPVEDLSPLIGRQLVHTENMTIARITLESGAAVPRHEHPHEQVATVLEGRLRCATTGCGATTHTYAADRSYAGALSPGSSSANRMASRDPISTSR